MGIFKKMRDDFENDFAREDDQLDNFSDRRFLIIGG